jgi:ribosomal protein S25
MSVEVERKTRKKRRWGRIVEYSSYERKYILGDVYDELKKKVEKSITKTKGFTPQEIAASNDIRVSVAKQILDDLEAEGKIIAIIKAHRIRVYSGSKA